MRDVAILFIHLVVTVARMFGLGSARSIVAESLLVKYALFILNRLRVRAPDLRPRARLIAGLRAILMRPARLVCLAVILKLFAILGFHRALVKRKCRLLFTPENRDKPGSKGPSAQLICAIIEMKRTTRASLTSASPPRPLWSSISRSIRMWCDACDLQESGCRRPA